jgi:hypothetical protein
MFLVSHPEFPDGNYITVSAKREVINHGLAGPQAPVILANSITGNCPADRSLNPYPPFEREVYNEIRKMKEDCPAE